MPLAVQKLQQANFQVLEGMERAQFLVQTYYHQYSSTPNIFFCGGLSTQSSNPRVLRKVQKGMGHGLYAWLLTVPGNKLEVQVQ